MKCWRSSWKTTRYRTSAPCSNCCPDCRLVFVLHAIEGYRQDQVARMMGTSPGTVKAQFHKASNQLKAWLGDSSGEDP